MPEPLRVAWLCPWFSTLATVYGRGLRSARHSVFIATTDSHFDASVILAADAPDGQLPPGVRRWADWREVANLRKALVRFAPDVVLLDETWDPRFHLLARGFPTLLLVHDADRHAGDKNRAVYRPLVGRARRKHPILAFSDHVAEGLRAMGLDAAAVVPLTTEFPGMPEVVPAEGRRDFCLFGRWKPYKNIPATLEVWEAYLASPSYQGDRLLLLGEGDPTSLPKGVDDRRGVFQLHEVAPLIAATKASLCWYGEASQSGVQLLSMQCGVTPLVSDVGGMPQYQGNLMRPIPLDDPAGLLRALEQLTDPGKAAAAGALARRRFDGHYASAPAAEGLIDGIRRGLGQHRRVAA